MDSLPQLCLLLLLMNFTNETLIERLQTYVEVMASTRRLRLWPSSLTILKSATSGIYNLKRRLADQCHVAHRRSHRRPLTASTLIIELMRSTGEREFPAQLMAIFFWIASHDGCKQEDLVKNCNMTPSSVSRCVTWLGPRHRLEHRSGLRLSDANATPTTTRPGGCT